MGISGIVGPLGIADNGREPSPPIAPRDGVVADPTMSTMVIGPSAWACTELRSRRRLSWAELMRRVFSLDVLECPVCQGPMKIIAEITQPEVIKRFLAALDLPTEHPEVERARPPPQLELLLDEAYEEPLIEVMDEGA
jgi:hypothetical protein